MLTIRDMPISPGLKTRLIVLKILGLGSKHPMELVLLLLNKATKSSVLRLNIGSKGYLFLLDGPKGRLEVGIVSGGGLEVGIVSAGG